MVDLQELSRVSYEIAKSKGWWDKERSFAALTLLMQSEISEALEDYRAKKGLNEMWYDGDKPCGIPSEIADVVIRICDFAGHYGIPLRTLTPTQPSESFEVALAKASLEISKAFDLLHHEAITPTTPGGRMVAIVLSMAVAHLEYMCRAQGIDLDKAIEIKTAFNRTRPNRHGGKAI